MKLNYKLKTIQNYVDLHKGWPRSSYSIKFIREEEGYEVYWVVHIDDSASMGLEKGKSIELYMSLGSSKIVKELNFQ